MRIAFLAAAFVRMACHMRFMGIGSVMMRQLMFAVVVSFLGAMIMVMVMVVIVFMSVIMGVFVLMVVLVIV